MARPEIEPKTPLGSRLREVRTHFGVDDRDEFASKLGISKSALAHYERGERVPDASVLAAYHEHLGINVSWLVSGAGSMFDDASKAPAPSLQVDPLLMEKLYKAVQAAYAQAGQKPPAHRIAHEAAALFNDLLARVSDVRDDLIVNAVIPTLATELVERLSRAAEEPGTGKRLA
ncbi:MAG: hypothetical protein BGN83_20240 [Rhizobium sp. 63-7]|nr:MAG: hypothetical protein BGN83_20240 [Rhizobium sp. 63-7]